MEPRQLSLERVLQILMATLATLATLMLGMGERNPMLPLLAIVVAVSSVYFTDMLGWIRLNTSVANLAGLAALVASLWDYKSVAQENQLLALANLLIYLQCVLLFREKTERIYWMLALLSLLQVAVATVLNMSIWFGALLLVYLFTALTTLSVFLMYREQSRFAELEQLQEPKPEGPQPPAAPRWSLARRQETFVPRANPAARGHVPLGLGRQVSRMGFYTLALTALLFLVVPRTGGSTWGDHSAPVQHTVGFADQVSLGELGEIIENPEEVFQIRFFDDDTNEPYPLGEIPLLRGSILMQYDQGVWSPTARHPEDNGPIPRLPPDRRGLVRQEVQIRKLDTKTLFGVFPLLKRLGDNRRGKLDYDHIHDRLTRKSGISKFPLTYETLTSGFQLGRQMPIIPVVRRPDFRRDELLQLPADDLLRLREMAKQIVEQSGSDNVVVRAKALERHLRDTGHYRYTLSPPKRASGVDPIEDFLLTNRVGHCEYFASALTLMLRSAGIPARMVVGFKGADWNPLTGAYHVRQLHAHTWVEVYLAPEQLPEGTWTAAGSQAEELPAEWSGGGWLRLDPTPGFEANLVMAGDRFPSLKHVVDYIDHLWSSYVLSMDSRRQREAIFNPVKRGSAGIVSVLFDRQMWSKTFVNLWKLLQGKRLDDAGMWFSWRAAVVTIVALLVLTILFRLVRGIVRRLWRLTHPARQEEHSRRLAEVGFYRRLETVLAAHDLVRGATQTQREFADQAARQLADRHDTSTVSPTPRRVVEAFYRVRFGGLALDNPESAALEHALDELEATLVASNGETSGHDLDNGHGVAQSPHVAAG